MLGKLACIGSVVAVITVPGCRQVQEASVPEGPQTPSGQESLQPRAFHRDDFSAISTVIDNKWLPMSAGTQFVFEGEANRGEGAQRHRDVFTVTDLTKVINGVRTRVVWDRDYNGEELVEAEIAFFAQDDNGNVWLFGEYPEEYEEGRFAGAPSTWIAGLAGAKPGVLMPANPQPGDPPFVQGLAPDIDFQDLAKVDKIGLERCVPAGCYKDVMVIDEWDPLDQPADGHQLKYQAPGVGNIRVEAVGGEEQEVLELTRVVQLDPEGMAQAAEEALKLDRHGYEVNARYADTPPAARLP